GSRIGADHRVAVQQDAAARIASAARQQLQQRKRGQRLAGAGFAHQSQCLAAVQGEGHVVHNALVAEGDGQVLDLDQAHVGNRRGSKESRTASPMKMSRVSTPPSTTKAVMPIPGACRLFLACATSSPSDGDPGGKPKPRKSSVDSNVTEPDRMNGR